MSEAAVAMAAAVEPRSGSCRSGIAWMALSLALLAHIVDEALTGFLDVYNPIVRSMRARYGWFPMPEFRVDVWITGLYALVLVLFALSPLVFRQSRAVRILAYACAAIMLLNGIGHLVASIYLGRWAPGASTAPLLIAASLWMFVAQSPRGAGATS